MPSPAITSRKSPSDKDREEAAPAYHPNEPEKTDGCRDDTDRVERPFERDTFRRSDDDITRSILKGMPVVAGQGRSAYARAVRELWTTFAAQTATPARRPGWALFGGTT